MISESALQSDRFSCRAKGESDRSRSGLQSAIPMARSVRRPEIPPPGLPKIRSRNLRAWRFLISPQAGWLAPSDEVEAQ
jgi:hypothetical protein